jgi:hypothetical protein
MDSTIRLLDVVALTVDRPEKGLIRGQSRHHRRSIEEWCIRGRVFGR